MKINSPINYLILSVVICAFIFPFHPTTIDATVPPEFWTGLADWSVSETLEYITKNNLTNELNFEVIVEESVGSSSDGNSSSGNNNGGLKLEEISDTLKASNKLEEWIGRTRSFVDRLELFKELSSKIPPESSQAIRSELTAENGKIEPFVIKIIEANLDAKDETLQELLKGFEKNITQMTDNLLDTGKRPTDEQMKAAKTSWQTFVTQYANDYKASEPKNDEKLKSSWEKLELSKELKKGVEYNLHKLSPKPN